MTFTRKPHQLSIRLELKYRIETQLFYLKRWLKSEDADWIFMLPLTSGIFMALLAMYQRGLIL